MLGNFNLCVSYDEYNELVFEITASTPEARAKIPELREVLKHKLNPKRLRGMPNGGILLYDQSFPDEQQNPTKVEFAFS